ncbi:nickel pincer cofactor biosynthesis protein LarB [Paenibacillus filicis]|uniref:Nickel pincer cofactor biosynthesis protein LarB n=1 Tax=Paenibacillus gyeongsangnamensis TaxID=3388067 RepID=A0ABT4QAD3_9BACL|nr:nickel pincer cofactor biosynthesis protein LarB [Paenibacillus filicis]MCZ8513779.1 nickel pincer cofactor biosynthesis protein LarB [Paenibacillus filicis]
MINVDNILKRVRSGEMDISEAKRLLLEVQQQQAPSQAAAQATVPQPVQRIDDTLGYAQLDVDRAARTGFPEVIFGEGKTAEQIAAIFQRLMNHTDRVLATRVSPDKAAYVLKQVPAAEYRPDARAVLWLRPGLAAPATDDGYIAVVCAGTSDVPVAEEAAVTAESMGCRVERVFDVGVAGIHRLFRRLPVIRGANAIVVAAGMEGALASVLGGLVSVPVIAVPTSIGYGASFQGIAALLSMLNACAPGISVVNIDNGFGAGYNAALIHKNRLKRDEQ